MILKEYVKEMRKLIGSRPLLMCGASVILLNAEGQVLLFHRTDNDSWSFPGGAIEPGEKVEEAARREAFEETGLRVGEMNLFGVFSGEELYYRYPNGDEVYNVDVVFISQDYEGDIRLSDEGKGVRFFSIDELPDKISPPVIPVVEQLVRTHHRTLNV
ncbi:NUDIX domain-containing protein [Paenibacillus sp. TRM 82003]|nr:NUDIX domain-containing protein [Paenibacillus sp. TRM 82003]